MEKYPQNKNITRQDIYLPNVYPVTGTLTNSNFDKLIETLRIHITDHKLSKPLYVPVLEGVPVLDGVHVLEGVPVIGHMSRDDNLLEIREKLKIANQAVIFSRKTSTNYVNESKRICNRVSFGQDIVNQIKESVIPDVKKAMTNFVVNDMTDVLIDPSHCDVLYYGHGGFFDEHRDTVPEFPYKNQYDATTSHTWRFYSVIIGLDSNTKDNDGSTIVYLPPRDFLVQYIDPYGFINFDSNVVPDRHMMRHTFRQPCRGGEFVVFSAEALHASFPVTSIDGFKLALKFDIWVRQPCVKSDYPPRYVSCGCDDKDCWHLYTKPRKPLIKMIEKNEYENQAPSEPTKTTVSTKTTPNNNPNKSVFDSYDYYSDIDECNGYLE